MHPDLDRDLALHVHEVLETLALDRVAATPENVRDDDGALVVAVLREAGQPAEVLVARHHGVTDHLQIQQSHQLVASFKLDK